VAGVAIVASYSITPSGGMSWLLMAMVVMILAGEGRINTILPAGLILGIIESLSVLVTGTAYREVVALVIFILVLLFRPRGIFTHALKGTPNGS
jgi:branched-chain amino acid transport system permease protein